VSLDGYSKPKQFIYRSQTGRKKKNHTIDVSEEALNLIPSISVDVDPFPIISSRKELYSINQNNSPINPEILPLENIPVETVQNIQTVETVQSVQTVETVQIQKIKRKYTKRKQSEVQKTPPSVEQKPKRTYTKKKQAQLEESIQAREPKHRKAKNGPALSFK
jgi:hypothetical protein